MKKYLIENKTNDNDSWKYCIHEALKKTDPKQDEQPIVTSKLQDLPEEKHLIIPQGWKGKEKEISYVTD